MVTLGDFRDWLRGKLVSGLPDRFGESPERIAVKAQKIDHEWDDRDRYDMRDDDKDAILKFGKHAGRKVSAIARTDPRYLDWLSREGDVPAELRVLAVSMITVPDETADDKRRKRPPGRKKRLKRKS